MLSLPSIPFHPYKLSGLPLKRNSVEIERVTYFASGGFFYLEAICKDFFSAFLKSFAVFRLKIKVKHFFERN